MGKSALRFLALVAAVCFAAGIAAVKCSAQTLTVADAPFDATPLLFLLVAGAAVAALVFLRRRDPAKFKQASKDVEHTLGTARDRVGHFVHGFEAFISEHRAPPAISPTPTSPAVQAAAVARANLIENAKKVFPNGFKVIEPERKPLPGTVLDNRSL